MFHSVSLLSQAPLARGSSALPSVLFNKCFCSRTKQRLTFLLACVLTFFLLAYTLIYCLRNTIAPRLWMNFDRCRKISKSKVVPKNKNARQG